MSDATPIAIGQYSHDLLLHDCDEELIAGITSFVEQGLESGGHVLVHSTKARVAQFKEVLGTHPRLEYGLDEDLYLSPSRTLFAYQRKLAESPRPIELWATGTVPLGDDAAGHPAWGRYESLVNEVLGPYAFHGLCSYDTQVLPERTIAAAKAAHPHVGAGDRRGASPEYQHPADFLADPLAGVPDPPSSPPGATMTIPGVHHLRRARDLVRRTCMSSSAVARDTVDDFVAAVNEVVVNGLHHGVAPVRLALWADPARLTCLVTDLGFGIADRLVGYRYPEPDGPKGLWVARQLCEDIFVGDLPGGGSGVLVIAE